MRFGAGSVGGDALTWWERHRSTAIQLFAAIAAGLVLGALLPNLPLFLAVALVPALLVAWWIAARPEIGLLLLVAVTGGLVNYDMLPYLSLGPMSLHLTDLLLLFLLGLAIVRLLVQRDFDYVSTKLDVPMLLFFGAVVLSVFTAILQFGVNPNIALREFRIVIYWLGFFAVTQLIRTRKQLNTLLKGLVVLSVAMTAAILLKYVFPGLPFVRVTVQTLVTVKTEFAGVARVWMTGERLIYVMLIVSICGLLLVKSKRQRWILGGVAAILLVWLFVSFQRNYWATAALSLGLLGLLLPWPERLRALRWVLLGLLAVALLLFLPISPLAPWGEAAIDRVFSVQGGRLEQDVSATLRQTELEHGWLRIQENPVFGVGIGNAYRPWIQRFDYQPDQHTYTSRGLTWYMHNSYMWIWVKMGTFALIFFLWLCFQFLYRGFRHWKQVADPWWRAVVLGFTLAFVGQMVSNLVAPNFVQTWILVIFAMMMAINELIYKWSPARSSGADQEKLVQE